MAIRTYDYTYGKGDIKNRQIQFFRKRTGTIEARIFVLINAATGATAPKPFSTIPENRITYHKTLGMNRFEESFSRIDRAIQNAIIKTLIGGDITISNDPISPEGLETITHIDIYK